MQFGTIYRVISSINPAFNTLSEDKAKEIATNILNIESSKVLENLKYDELVTIVKDKEEKIKMLQINTVKINLVASEIAYNIQQELSKKENNKIEIPIGAITGSKYLAGFGPKITIQIIPSGSVITNLKSEFKSVGINQTMHRIYMEAVCNVRIITPYDMQEEIITNQVLMAEYVIVGEIPESYYNLEGIEQSDYLDTIQ